MSNVFTLSEPVTFEGKTYAVLNLRPLKGRDLVAMDSVKGEVRKSMALFASATGVPLPVIEDLSLDDFEALGEAMQPFLGRSAKARAVAAKEAEKDAASE